MMLRPRLCLASLFRLAPALLCSTLLLAAHLLLAAQAHAAPRLARARLGSALAQPNPATSAPSSSWEQEVKAIADATEANAITEPPSHPEMSLPALRQLFDAQDKARLRVAEGTTKRAGAAEAEARTAADLAWKYFHSEDAEAASPWFARRQALRLEAYRTRRAIADSLLTRIDKRLQNAPQVLEAAHEDLKQHFPDLHRSLLASIEKAGLPPRPVASSSSMSVQRIVMDLQQEQVEARRQAVANKDEAEAQKAFEAFMALDGFYDALAEPNMMRLLRVPLPPQRWHLALAFEQSSDTPALAAQDLAEARQELKAITQSGEAPQAVAAGKVALAQALDSDSKARASLGQVEAALGEQDEAMALRRSLGPEHPESTLATPFWSLGNIHGKLGQAKSARGFYLKALDELERSRALIAAAPTTPAPAAAPDENAEPQPRPQHALAEDQLNFTEGLVLNNLAVVTSDAGDINEGLALLDRARAVIEKVGATEAASPRTSASGAGTEAKTGARPEMLRIRRSLLATTRSNRAVTLLNAGRPQGVGEDLQLMAAEFRALGEDDRAATVLLNVAGVYFGAGQEDKARASTLQARSFFALAQQPRGLMMATTFLAKLELRAGRLDEAARLSSQALSLARGSGDLAWTATALRAQASLSLKRKQPAAALQVLAQARALDQQVGAPQDAARTLELEGDALAQQIPANAPQRDARRASAIARYQESVALLEEVRAHADPEGFGETEALYGPYQSLVRLLIQDGRGEEAFDTLQRARSRKLRDSLRLDAIQTRDPALQVLLNRVQEAEDKLRAVREALQSEQSKPQSERSQAQIGVLRNEVASTQAEFLRLTRELGQKNPTFARVVSVKPELLKSRQADIPADTALVQYVPLGEQLYIFVITRESLKIYAPPVRPAELTARIRELRRRLDEARARYQKGEDIGVEDWATQKDVAPLRDNLTALYSMLIAPIEAEVSGKGTLAFIPTQVLYYLPLHALAHQTPNGLRFLIEDKRVAYLSSDNALNFVREQKAGQVGEGVVALGDPKGADLPFSGEEARRVAQIFRDARQDAQLVSGEAATKPALLAPRNEERRVWHLATHGFLNQKEPLNSYIQLAPSGDGKDLSTAKLTIGEVWGLNLKRVDLVTLSACQTALGERDPDGGEITSLADAFSGAGAQSVLASLWSVADDSTSTLMTNFYRSLAGGKGKAQSLQEAELALLRNPKTNHPFFWAPFVLMGDWR